MKAYTHQQVIDMLLVRQGDRSQRKLAEEIGVQESYISALLAGRATPGPKILEFLGLEKGFLQVKK